MFIIIYIYHNNCSLGTCSTGRYIQCLVYVYNCLHGLNNSDIVNFFRLVFTIYPYIYCILSNIDTNVYIGTL